MQQALEQVAEFLEKQNISYTRGVDVVVWPQQDPGDIPIVFTEGQYPGWVYATFSFCYDEEGPPSVEGLSSLRKAAERRFGGRVKVFCEGRDLSIVGRLRSDPERLQYEIEDYIEASRFIFPLLCAAVQFGHWKESWNGLAFGQAAGNA